jgi:hypothetical protein
LAFHPEREADHSPPSSAEVKEWVDLYLHPQYAFMAWCLVRGSTGTTLPLYLKERDRMKVPGLCEGIIFKWILKK